jgi:hypothetical protein
LVYGVRERQDRFKEKVGGEEEIANREAWFGSDRRCDFWLDFENGVKFLVEMADHVNVDYKEIPALEPLPIVEEPL